MNEQDENYGLLVLRFGAFGGRTPDRPDEVAALLDHGDAMNWLDPRAKETVLHEAARYGHTKTVAMLLDRGVDVNAKDKRGNTALGPTALRWASENGHTKTASLLLDRGADVDARTEWGDTPLHRSAAGGHTETASLLLDRGADVNAKTEEGMTALMEAARGRNVEAMALLLDRGADVDAKTEWGGTALKIAGFHGESETTALLRAAEQARSLAAALDSARPPETVPEPPSPVRLSNDPMNRAPREDLGAPDPRPVCRRVRL